MQEEKSIDIFIDENPSFYRGRSGWGGNQYTKKINGWRINYEN